MATPASLWHSWRASKQAMDRAHLITVLAEITFAVALSAAADAVAQPTRTPEEKPLLTLPYTPSLDLRAMDRSANPCTDFYQYTCGGWMKSNPIPPDQSRWDVYGKLAQENRQFLWGVVTELANRASGRTDNQQRVGDYFAACMDESAVEALGVRPLQPLLNRIDGMQSKAELPVVLAELHMKTGSSGLFFDFDSNQDYADASSVIAFASAGGIGLPDRDYYVKDDEATAKIRTAYRAHLVRTFELLGDTPKDAVRDAETVMRIETALAKASLTRTDQRDPYKLFHKMDRRGLQTLTPGFDWTNYLTAVSLSGVDTFNVTEPEFFAELARQLSSLELQDIKVYLRWHVARAMSSYLSTPFVTADFDFYGRTLNGAEQLRPRWKRCLAQLDRDLGEALGQEYVARAFTPELKQQALKMTRQIEEAMAEDIRALPWMSPGTRQRALEKLATIVNKIGYPDKWRDYRALSIARDDYAGNVMRSIEFEQRRQLSKIGKPLDRNEWFMTPPTVNAYYSGQMNDVNFPAGVLQPPLFDPKMDAAPNYGNTGATIAHELTHGFDDEGRQFDAQGNLKDWWTPEDAAEYDRRAQCIVDQFAEYTIVDDIKINSKLTLGEDIADLGGLVLAWAAWQKETAGTKLESRDGFTPEQRFFIGAAQWACSNERPENLRVSAVVDPHSPPRYRVNGPFANLPEFSAAFQCKPGDAMVRAKRCRVW